MNGIVPKIDIVVIQMDGDVSRKEKEIHCVCESVSCDHREEEISPVRCSYAKKGNVRSLFHAKVMQIHQKVIVSISADVFYSGRESVQRERKSFLQCPVTVRTHG